jgi:hypothetical protein
MTLGGKCFRTTKNGLRKISLGKYHTVLTVDGSTSTTSVIGGIVSILLYVILGSAILFSLFEVFSKKNWNLSIEKRQMQARYPNGTFICSESDPNCFKISIEQFFKTNISFFVIDFKGTFKIKCEDLSVGVI